MQKRIHVDLEKSESDESDSDSKFHSVQLNKQHTLLNHIQKTILFSIILRLFCLAIFLLIFLQYLFFFFRHIMVSVFSHILSFCFCLLQISYCTYLLLVTLIFLYHFYNNIFALFSITSQFFFNNHFFQRIISSLTHFLYIIKKKIIKHLFYKPNQNCSLC